MSLSDLASIGSLVSGVAVLGSLIYLALQVRQTDRNQQAAIRHSRITRHVDILLARADPGLVVAWENGARNPDQITETELNQFIVLCRAQFLTYEDAFYQHEEGLLNEDAFATVLSGVRGVLRIPGYRVAWKEQLRRGYDGRFRDFMDGLVARASLEPAPPRQSLDTWRAAYAAEAAAAPS
jgi:hypothetical protein